MVALAAGERSEFRHVYEALSPILRRFCEQMLADADQAKDAAQAAMAKLFFHASDFDPERDATSWALGFASFECLSARNRRARRREASDEGLAELHAAGPTPEESSIERELREAAIEALGQLRPTDVETIRAALAGERPAAAAFRKRLQRALERLRVVWRSKHGTD